MFDAVENIDISTLPVRPFVR